MVLRRWRRTAIAATAGQVYVGGGRRTGIQHSLQFFCAFKVDKVFVGLHQSVRYEKRLLSKPSKQQAFGKWHMQEVNKQAVKRNPG